MFLVVPSAGGGTIGSRGGRDGGERGGSCGTSSQDPSGWGMGPAGSREPGRLDKDTGNLRDWPDRQSCLNHREPSDRITHEFEFEDSKESLRPFDEGSNVVGNSFLNVKTQMKIPKN